MKNPVQHLELVNAAGQTLRGYLTLPPAAQQIVVMLHGYTGNKTEHSGHFRNLARLLARNGIASLRMDYSCNGESDGEFQDFTFEAALADSELMFNYARGLGLQETVLLGFSMGGAIASALAARLMPDRLVLWSPAGDLGASLTASFAGRKVDAAGNYRIPGFLINRKLIAGIAAFDFFASPVYQGPVLICYGEKDLAVPRTTIDKYRKRYAAARVALFADSAHGYDYPGDAERLYAETLSFLRLGLEMGR